MPRQFLLILRVCPLTLSQTELADKGFESRTIAELRLLWQQQDARVLDRSGWVIFEEIHHPGRRYHLVQKALSTLGRGEWAGGVAGAVETCSARRNRWPHLLLRPHSFVAWDGPLQSRLAAEGRGGVCHTRPGFRGGMALSFLGLY